jgi:hypothetical protein
MTIEQQTRSIYAILHKARVAPDNISYESNPKSWLVTYPPDREISTLLENIENIEFLFVLSVELRADKLLMWITDNAQTAYLADWNNLTRYQQESIKWIHTIGGADYGVRVIELTELGIVSYDGGKFQLNAYGESLLLAATGGKLQ